MISFANPLWLWGGLSMLIPLAIHFLSLGQSKLRPWGSTQFLEEGPMRKFRNFRLNEIHLLLLRCLMLIILTLFLAGTNVSCQDQRKNKWLLLTDDFPASPLIDSLSAAGWEVRWFDFGFPLAESTIRPDSVRDYFSLMRLIASTPAEEVVIYGPRPIEKFINSNHGLPRVRWISPPVKDEFFSLFKYEQGGKARVREGETTALYTAFQTIDDSAQDFQVSDTMYINIIYENNAQSEKRTLRTALEVIERFSHVKFVIRENTNALPCDWTFHLENDITPHNGKCIRRRECVSNPRLWSAPAEADLWCPVEQHVPTWIISRRLTVDQVLEDQFLYTMGRMLLPEYNLDYPDRRELPERFVQGEKNISAREKTVPLEIPLLVFFVAIGIFERIVSWKKGL